MASVGQLERQDRVPRLERGAQTNMAVYLAALDPGDTILSLELSHGGHLTHGLKVNFSGRLYTIAHYGVSRETMMVDYDEVLARDLKFADATAISLCRDNALPIVVFNLLEEGNIARAVHGEKLGTIVSAGAR
jgi:hypothetical protein